MSFVKAVHSQVEKRRACGVIGSVLAEAQCREWWRRCAGTGGGVAKCCMWAHVDCGAFLRYSEAVPGIGVV